MRRRDEDRRGRHKDDPLGREPGRVCDHGDGFHWVHDLPRRVTPVPKALMERGVLALPAGPTVLRLLPPLIVSEDQLSEVLDAILEALELSQDE